MQVTIDSCLTRPASTRQGKAIALAVIFMSSLLTDAHAATPQPVSDPSGQWVLLSDYSDDFSGSELDPSKWTTDVHNWGTWSWSSDNVSLDAGRLAITMRYDPHKDRDKTLLYTSGIVESVDQPILYGYFEAKIKAAPRFPGVCSSFWLYNNAGATWTEIDIVELQDNQFLHDALAFTTHIWRIPGAVTKPQYHQQWAAPGWDPSAGYHIYGLKWTRNVIEWYVDGRKVASQRNKYLHQPLYVMFSAELRRPLTDHPSENGFPTAMSVDYVRVWAEPKAAASSEAASLKRH